MPPVLRRFAWLLLAAASSCGNESGSDATSPGHNCTRRILVAERQAFTGPPPRDMPAHLRWAYTRCGAIPEASYFVDDTRGGQGTHIRYSKERVDELVASANQLVSMVRSGAGRGLGKRAWLTEAITRHPQCVAGARTAVIGSMTPIVETLLLALGSPDVTAVEYNNLSYGGITTMKPAEFEREDFPGVSSVFSISSYDHDGLSRYGDPTAPDGDLLSMAQLRRMMLRWREKEEASAAAAAAEGTPSACASPLLFLTVPVGPDVVVWNLHRRYGRVRLPLLLAGFSVVDAVGWDAALLDAAASFAKTHEPVLVLRPLPPAAAQTEEEAADALHSSVRRLMAGKSLKKAAKKGALAGGEGSPPRGSEL